MIDFRTGGYANLWGFHKVTLEREHEMEHVYLISRTTLTFFVILILARILGKKQISQLTYFNYVTGITIGSIAANIISKSNEPFIDEFLGLIWWCALTGIISYAGLKSGKFRCFVDGEPTIVIKKGALVKSALKSAKLDMDEISMLLREQNIFSVRDVEYAVLETNGNLSVLKKAGKQQATKLDVNAPLTNPNNLPAEIIVDGKLVKKSLTELNLDEGWLVQQLSLRNIHSYQEVLYCELQEDGSIYIMPVEESF